MILLTANFLSEDLWSELGLLGGESYVNLS